MCHGVAYDMPSTEQWPQWCFLATAETREYHAHLIFAFWLIHTCTAHMHTVAGIAAAEYVLQQHFNALTHDFK